MKIGTPINAIKINEIQELPNGVSVAITDCCDYDAFKQLPKAIEIDNVSYGFTGWNSDRFIAYFRTDATLGRF